MKKSYYAGIIISVIMILLAACCSFAQEEETEKEVKYKNGYPVVEIDSPIHYNGAYNNDAKKLAKSHPFEEYQDYILFYGDSNFRLWSDTIEEDFSEYRVIDHGFGGSTAVDLVHFANTLLFRYQSPIVVLQNGLNDFGVLSGEDDSSRSDELMSYREEMLNAFHEIMPDTVFVFVSTLIVPGRTEFFDLAMDVNRRTKELADKYDYLYFVDSTDLTYDGTSIHEDLFIEDGLHLTDETRTVWADQYIKPMIEQIITEYGFDCLRKTTVSVSAGEAVEFDIHTEQQRNYLADENPENIFAYANGLKDNSKPEKLHCDFSGDEGIGESETYIFQKSADEQFTDPVTVTGLKKKEYDMWMA